MNLEYLAIVYLGRSLGSHWYFSFSVMSWLRLGIIFDLMMIFDGFFKSFVSVQLELL